jgi:cytochrome c oxidase cbb3-type subunit 3
MICTAATGLALLAGCQVEKRDLGPSAPATSPVSRADPRARHYETNRYEMSEGGRLFRWVGCGGCHSEGSRGFDNLADNVWRRGGETADIYGAIAQGAPGMPSYAARLTPQQTWQVAGYVRGLHRQKANQRRRSDDALKGEPAGSAWTGPLT